ncbi:protein of unassigned function [Methylobacterium oryzae CBMB20]|uniref:Protein of unassigned function n=1 Tax=Methylobacterium oryzae CBMB20 TaxID=693986 RepID=A0A089NU38_9HYPH|nr:protein of unassigned function [Methylobacterium oryzae CBMB20]
MGLPGLCDGHLAPEAADPGAPVRLRRTIRRPDQKLNDARVQVIFENRPMEV